VSRLRPERLHVRLVGDVEPAGALASRRYTLTHSDVTGDLFLTVGTNDDRRQISGWYTRLMWDEVLAEWRVEDDGPSLHVYCHVSGGLVFGTAGLWDAIFRRELPLVLEAFRQGDRSLFEASPDLDKTPILVYFRSLRRCYRRLERWGTPADYRL
jgi:hypothetical protein